VILDSGFAFFHKLENTAPPGGKPTLHPAAEAFFASFYGELNFETSPIRPTENREEVKTDARIRVLQNRNIRNTDVVYLMNAEGERKYSVTRAYHGTDADSGDLITDLNLEEVKP